MIKQLVLALPLVAFTASCIALAQEDFRPLFNGIDLSDWDCNPDLWSIEDGCITGKTTGPEQLTYNQFLIWRGGVVKNFELRLKVKQSGNNTGIQYRSRELPEVGKWSVAGYQCDIHPAAPNNSMVYGEKAGGILGQNGQSVVIDPEGIRWLVSERDPVKVDVAQWHEYTIIAQGNHIVHKIDGQTTVELRDFDSTTRAAEGLLAFQIHRGPAMKVQIKDVMLKVLPASSIVAFDKASLPAGASPIEKAKRPAKEKANRPSKTDSPSPKSKTEPTTSASGIPKDGLKWLWSESPDAKTAARLKKDFELGEAAVTEAVLRVTCDNGAKVFLNGEPVLTNPDWQKPSQADVQKYLHSGRNTLLAEATNKGSAAGFVASLSLRFADGIERTILTDATWMAAAAGTEAWTPARVVANYGSKPWGDIFADHRDRGAKRSLGAASESSEVTPPAAIRTLPGFKVELIHTVSKAEEGSWVGLTVDDQGRLIACDQYGGLHRLTPPAIGSQQTAKVEKLATDISGAHGLLYAFDSLYVMVNQEPETAGLYRLRDTLGTGQFDEKTLLREIKGRNEHGNHSIVLSPDRQNLYIACGNGTVQPQLEHTRLSRPFSDDQVLPRIQRGAAFSDTEPQAFTCKVSPDGKRFEMVVAGLRNHFDIAFNALGDLFTYDSDMEWDAGTPWYRPTRIYQLVSGGDYGFRESSGKLLEYCPDVVPPLINVGPGSPTGMVSGLGAAFPAAYQHAIFACDWTYGTLYAIHLTPEGAGYKARLEEFVTGKPLPLTDAVIGKDGAMYLAIGGRRTQSGVYRVSYVGNESTAPAAALGETEEHKLRVELERLHDEGIGTEAIDKAWPHLGHPDRLVRWAARVAIERQPSRLWSARALKQTEPWAAIESAVALARMGGKERQNELYALLNGIEVDKITDSQRLGLVRAYQIALARNGLPEGPALAQTIARLDAMYPATTNDLNRELSRTLIAFGGPTAVNKTLQLMAEARDDEVSWLSSELLSRNDRYGPNFLRTGPSRPNAQQIAYAYALRMAKTGWTPEAHRTFFAWFDKTASWQGGNQFRGFLDQIRADALANVTDPDERKFLSELSSHTPVAAASKKIVAPKGPGKNYSVDEVVAFAKNGLHDRNFERGRQLYIAAACQACHRLGNDGGGAGPDLTRSASRYTLRDLLENIVDPSKVISDQYASTLFLLTDGSALTGRITSEESGKVFIAANPAAPHEITELKIDDIESRKDSPVSLMAPGLINNMNPKEVMDLIAYVLSGGDKTHAMFKP